MRERKHNQRRDQEHNKNTFQASFPIFFLQERVEETNAHFAQASRNFICLKEHSNK